MTPELLEALRQMSEGAAPPMDTTAPVSPPPNALDVTGPLPERPTGDDRAIALDVVRRGMGTQVPAAKDLNISPGTPGADQKRGESELVKAYLARMAQGNKADPQMEDALGQSKNLRLAGQLFGGNRVGANASVAYGIAGVPPPQGKGPEIDSEAPVRDVLASRKAASDQTEQDLKNLNMASQIDERGAMADSRRAMADPNSPKYQMAKAALAQKIQAMELRAEQLRLAAAKGMLTKAHLDEWADLTGRLATARELMAQTSADKFSQSLAADTEKRSATAGGVGGDQSNMDIHDKRTAGEIASAQTSLEGAVDEIKGLKDRFGYGSIPKTEKDRLEKTLYGILQPLVSTATGQGRFTLAHQHLAADIMGSPNGGWLDRAAATLDPEAIDAQLDMLKKISREEANVRLHGLVGGDNLHVAGQGEGKAAPRVYNRQSGSYEAKQPAGKGLNKVKMISPTGKLKMVDPGDVRSAIESGGKVAD